MKNKFPKFKQLIQSTNLVFLFAFLSLTKTNAAQVNPNLDEKIDEKRNAILVQIEGVNIQTNRGSVSAIGTALNYRYSLYNYLAVGSQFRQTFSTKGINGLHSALEVHLAYALTGNFFEKTETTNLENKTVVKFSNPFKGGLRLGIIASQNYVYLTNTTLSYSGIGGILYYDFVLNDKGLYLNTGVRADKLAKGKQDVDFLSLLFGIGTIF